MKKTILLAFLGAGLFTANAQTATATLNVKLAAVQSITINSMPIVDMEYNLSTDYSGAGVEATAIDHLKVVSSGGFVISVSVPSEEISASSSPTEKILASGIKIVASYGTGNNDGSTFEPLAPLTTGTTTTGEVLLTSTTGGASKLYTVKYQGAGSGAYFGKRIGLGTTTYTTPIQYSIIAN